MRPLIVLCALALLAGCGKPPAPAAPPPPKAAPVTPDVVKTLLASQACKTGCTPRDGWKLRTGATNYPITAKWSGGDLNIEVQSVDGTKPTGLGLTFSDGDSPPTAGRISEVLQGLGVEAATATTLETAALASIGIKRSSVADAPENCEGNVCVRASKVLQYVVSVRFK